MIFNFSREVLCLSNYRHLLLAVQRWKPGSRPFLQVGWELVRRWEFQEPVVHRTPVPESVVKALISHAFLLGWFEWVGITLLAFYGAGRVGEVIRCRKGDLVPPRDCFGENPGTIFLQLRSFKLLMRQGARIQRMKITNSDAVKLLDLIYGNYPTASLLFHGSSHQYRKRWDFLVESFGIRGALKLTPHSLRGGAAVTGYRSGRPLAEILWAMRLRNISTLENYLQEVSSLTFLTSLAPSTRASLVAASSFFPFWANAAGLGSLLEDSISGHLFGPAPGARPAALSYGGWLHHSCTFISEELYFLHLDYHFYDCSCIFGGHDGGFECSSAPRWA